MIPTDKKQSLQKYTHFSTTISRYILEQVYLFIKNIDYQYKLLFCDADGMYFIETLEEDILLENMSFLVSIYSMHNNIDEKIFHFLTNNLYEQKRTVYASGIFHK